MNVLIYGDTVTSPALRHELPLAIVDAFLYLESDGGRAVLTNVLEGPRLARAAAGVELLYDATLGRDELVAAGLPRPEIQRELCLRAAAKLGIGAATVPPEFPLALADYLRNGGIEISTSDELFAARRRHKTEAELAGVRRAASAALAAMREAARLLREATIEDDQLLCEGEPLTSEAVRDRMRDVCARAGAIAPADIIVQPFGPEPPSAHESGSGPLPPHTPIVIDLWPQDEASGCWADMTRTFVRGAVSDSIAVLHELVLEAHRRSCAAVSVGIKGADLYGVGCEVIEAAGYPTARTKKPGELLDHGFYFALGHGVGLEVHEEPYIGRGYPGSLVDGDVIAIEPGVIAPGLGGSRVEDLLIVTAAGSENLTAAFPYDLAP
jgi:Xaa-Pro aminopeptidase